MSAPGARAVTARSGGTTRRRQAGLSELGELRLRLTLRRLRGRGGTAEGVALLLMFVMAVPVGLFFAGVVGVGSYRAARAAHGLQATIPIAAIVYGVWQSWTAVSLTMNERDAIDLRRLLVYPVPPSRLYLAGLGTSLVADPFALFWLVLLAGMVAGAAVARPGAWLLLLAVVLGAFAVATVALVALAQELLARIARHRRWRELAALTALAGWLLIVFALASGPALHGARPLLRQARWLLYPAALAAEAAEHLYAQRPARALPWLLLLAAAAVATGWVAYRVALSTARSGGEEARIVVGRSGRKRTFLPERLGPLFEKEVLYLLRHPAARIYLVILPALSALLGWKGPFRTGGELAELVAALPLFGLAAYVHLAVQMFWVNALGWERGGARVLFLAPVPPRQVLAAKNLALATYACTLFALSGGAYLIVAGPPRPWALGAATALAVGLAPVLYALGNVVSVMLPRAAPFGVQRAGALSPVAAMAAMAITSGALALYAAPVLIAVWMDALWVVPFAWAALAVAGAVVWWVTLPATAALLASRREEILGAICGDAT